MPRTTRRTPTHGAITLCCAPFQATCRRRVETPAAAPPSQTQQRIAHRKAVSVARKPPRGRPASCLFIRHYWGHRSYFLLLRRVICLSSAGSSACLRSIACKPPPERAAAHPGSWPRAPRRGRRGRAAKVGGGGCGAPRRRGSARQAQAAGAEKPGRSAPGSGTRIPFLSTRPGSGSAPRQHAQRPVHTVPRPAAAPPRVRPTPVPAPRARGGHQRKRHSNGVPLTRDTAAACRTERGRAAVRHTRGPARHPRLHRRCC